MDGNNGTFFSCGVEQGVFFFFFFSVWLLDHGIITFRRRLLRFGVFRLSEKMAMTSAITLPVNSRVQSQ